MEKNLLKWVDATLHNDEASSDTEMEFYFVGGGLSIKEAQKAISQRNKCLNDIRYQVKL